MKHKILPGFLALAVVSAMGMAPARVQAASLEDVKQNLQIILSAITLVKNGYSIYIAPEGTRNATDTLLEFKEGSMKIATKGKCPIIPVCLCNTENIFENNLPWIKKGKILIEYGKPIYPDELDKETKKHLGVYVRGIIEEMYEENRKKIS